VAPPVLTDPPEPVLPPDPVEPPDAVPPEPVSPPDALLPPEALPPEALPPLPLLPPSADEPPDPSGVTADPAHPNPPTIKAVTRKRQAMRIRIGASFRAIARSMNALSRKHKREKLLTRTF